MNPKYPLLLLDADDTLFDFSKAERQAFGQTCAEFGLPDDEETYRLYSTINDGYWIALGRGEITKRELVIRRFEDLFRALSVSGSPRKINARYLQNLSEGWFLLPGVEDICKTLAARHRLVIASNSVDRALKRRLALSPIAPYISAAVSSDRAGADKPDPDFFRFLFREIGETDKASALMVGDRLETDIRGGLDFGLDTCWLNPRRLPPPPDCRPTYDIPALSLLVEIASSGRVIPEETKENETYETV